MYRIILLIAKCLLASQWIKSNTQRNVKENKTLSENSTHPTLNNEIKEVMTFASMNLSEINCSKFYSGHKFNSTNHQEPPPWRLNDPKDEVFWSLFLKDVDLRNETKQSRTPLARWSRETSTDIPYFVVFPVKLEGGEITMCSGTLVTLEWVLTAAHCLNDNNLRGKVYAGADFNVISAVPPADLPEGVQEGHAVAFHPHPDYDAKDPSNDRDLALVKVYGFRNTRFVEPVQLSLEPWRPAGYRDCHLTAFGQSDQGGDDKPKDYSRKTHRLEVVRPCNCLYAIMKRTGREGSERLICTKPKKDLSLCPGSSGGGLVCDGQVRGVASYSVVYGDVAKCEIQYFYDRFTTASCGYNMTSSVFQEVYSSLDWLNTHLKLFKVDGKSHKSSSSTLRYNRGLFSLFSLILLLFHIV